MEQLGAFNGPDVHVFGLRALTVNIEAQNKHVLVLHATGNEHILLQLHRPTDVLENQKAAVIFPSSSEFACVFRG